MKPCGTESPEKHIWIVFHNRARVLDAQLAAQFRAALGHPDERVEQHAPA